MEKLEERLRNPRMNGFGSTVGNLTPFKTVIFAMQGGINNLTT